MTLRVRAAVAAALVLSAIPYAQAAGNGSEEQSLNELRNTVVNLLQALVDKGLLTREQAEQMVKQAQTKAANEAAAKAAQNAAQAKDEANAVRVPYVPQIVKDEISKEVAQEVKPAVVADVVQEAKAQGWGIPASLPEWLSRVRVFGDVLMREQNDIYSKDNDQIFDFNAINIAGGFPKTTFPYLDTTHDRNRFRLRARLGVEGDLTPHLRAFIRLASGAVNDPSSESQTLGTYSQRYNVGLDQGYIVWDSNVQGQLSHMTALGGRISNPWFSPTELVYARDLSFEGVASTFRWGWSGKDADASHVYLTLAGLPVLEVPLANQENKWLVGAQIGTNLRWAEGTQHLKFGAAYYDFLHFTGILNDPNAPGLTNYSAPAFIRFGNSVFDISNNPADPTVNLFALSAHFRLVDLAANYQIDFPHRLSLALTGEGVRNIGYKRAEVEAVSGAMPSDENRGYVGEVSFGNPSVEAFGRWRAAVGYRYVKRDAVIDAWTDADFHGGGTNAQGYYVWTQFGLAKNTWLRARYMSANEVDGPRFGLDIFQLDINARF
jgi:Putative porin